MHEQSRLSPEVISTPFKNSSKRWHPPSGGKNSLPQFISDTESLSRIKKIIFNNIFNSHSTAQMSVTSCVAFLARRESRSALRDSGSVRIIEA